jgi:hypothetical protein
VGALQKTALHFHQQGCLDGSNNGLAIAYSLMQVPTGKLDESDGGNYLMGSWTKLLVSVHRLCCWCLFGACNNRSAVGASSGHVIIVVLLVLGLVSRLKLGGYTLRLNVGGRCRGEFLSQLEEPCVLVSMWLCFCQVWGFGSVTNYCNVLLSSNEICLVRSGKKSSLLYSSAKLVFCLETPNP